MIFRLRTFLLRIVYTLVFFVAAKSCITDYVKGGDQSKIIEWQRMLDDNTFVTASLSNEYTETTLARVVKYYEFGYSFQLDKKNYTGKISLNDLPSSNKIKLFYLKENPNLVSEDPYSRIKKEIEKGKSISDLIIGIIFGILSILFFISLIESLKSKKESRKIKIQAEEISDQGKINLKINKEKIQREKENPNRFMP